MNPLVSRRLPIELTNGNDGRGSRWFSSANLRKTFESQLRLLREERQPFDELVDVRITRILGYKERKWDADSVLRGSAKELIDALVAVGWFHDDGPRYIRHCDGRQDTDQRENGPAVLVEVFSIDEPAQDSAK